MVTECLTGRAVLMLLTSSKSILCSSKPCCPAIGLIAVCVCHFSAVWLSVGGYYIYSYPWCSPSNLIFHFETFAVRWNFVFDIWMCISNWDLIFWNYSVQCLVQDRFSPIRYSQSWRCFFFQSQHAWGKYRNRSDSSRSSVTDYLGRCHPVWANVAWKRWAGTHFDLLTGLKMWTKRVEFWSSRRECCIARRKVVKL